MEKRITPYLSFNGNAKEALELYKEVFHGEVVEYQTYGEANFPIPPEVEQLIIHAKFQKDEFYIMISDSFPGQAYEVNNNISLAVELESEMEIQIIYEQLSRNGSVLMELQDTFWGTKYAKVQDAYGVIWDLNYIKLIIFCVVVNFIIN